MTATLAGWPALYVRRLQLSLRGATAMIGQLASPVLWVLVVGPAMASALGNFAPGTDYYTYIALGQIGFLVPFTAMFAGTTVIADRLFGILPEITVAPVRRAVYPLANAAVTLTVASAQAVLMLVLAATRGAELHSSWSRAPYFAAGVTLLCLALYGCAETLAHRIPRFEAYGPLIPAIGVTPFLLSGSLYPLSSLPGWIQSISKVLPWTHAVALIRYGAMRGDNGLATIWHRASEAQMAALSTAVLAAYAVVGLTLAVRSYRATTTS
ncbi:MAG TPA: ABC transporter permease [Acidimicrobiales bacterium]|nr:ABC transporter permease [Acidimicrobiales bacterium]